MTDPLLSPTCPAASDTREALLEAALLCFAKYGYEAASIRLVASMAGKNTSLISYHFGSKEGLYRAVIQHLLADLSKPIDPDPEAGASPRKQLWNYIFRVLSELDTTFSTLTPCGLAARKLWLNELSFPRPEVQDLLLQHLGQSVQELNGVIQGIRANLSARQVAFWGITIQGCCMAHALSHELNRLLWPDPTPLLSLAEVTDHLTDFTYHGLTCSE